MLRSGTIHAVSNVAGDTGGRIAVTMKNNPGKGVLVWAGVLHDSAVGKTAEQISASDYSRRQIVSFSCWPDVWNYFQDNAEFAPLLASLQDSVEQHVAS